MSAGLKPGRAVRRSLLVVAALVSALVIAGCGDDSSPGSGSGSTSGAAADIGLMKAGTLTVGMNLQFKPEMYLDDAGKPAGYDVDLLNKLATELGVKLDIQNLDFNGLIPGLQSKKFDMVSVGFTATDERKKVIDFTREYVPYTSVLAVGQNDSTAPTIDAYNVKGKVITALQGSSGEQLAKKSFPNATVKGFPDQNAALLEVATGRAQGSVLEDYILAQYQKSNPNQVKKADLPKPLELGYGNWAVQKGNSKLQTKLNTFLCKAQSDGTLESLYKQDFGVTEFPEMPSGC
jgi:ABC-type amino acid transport substrate-binding protein